MVFMVVLKVVLLVFVKFVVLMRDDVGVYGVCGIDGADSIGCSKISDISVCDGSVDGGGGVIKHLLTE